MQQLVKLFAILVFIVIGSEAYAAVAIQDRISFSQPRSWYLSGFSLLSNEVDQSQEGGASFYTYNYLSMNRKLSSSSKFALRVPFSYQTYGYSRYSGENVQNQQMRLEDVIFSYSRYNVALLPGDIEVNWEGRIYMPTGESSRMKKQIARLKNVFILSKALTHKLEVDYWNKFDYYHQSQTAYKNQFIGDEGDLVTVASLTKAYKVDQWASIWYSFSSATGIGFKVGTEDTWWNESKVEGKKKTPEHLVKVGPSFRFELGRSANFILGVDNRVDNRGEMQDLGKFRAEQTEVVLLSFLKF